MFLFITLYIAAALIIAGWLYIAPYVNEDNVTCRPIRKKKPQLQ